MMPWIGATLIAIGFLGLLRVSNVVGMASRVGATARQAMELFRDPAIDEDAKEKQMQSYAIALFKLFFLIVLAFAAALALPLALIWCLEQTGVVTVREVLAAAVSVRFLVATTVIFVAAWIVLRGLRRGS